MFDDSALFGEPNRHPMALATIVGLCLALSVFVVGVALESAQLGLAGALLAFFGVKTLESVRSSMRI